MIESSYQRSGVGVNERRARRLRRWSTGWLSLGLLVALSLLTPVSAFAQGGTRVGDAAKGDESERKLTKSPKLLEKKNAEYTDEALEKRIEGTVKMKLTVDEEGNVTKVEILEGLGHGLDEAAREAAKDFKFRPAEINGEPAPVRLNFSVRFSLPARPATFQGKVLDENDGPVTDATIEVEYTGEETSERYQPPPTASVETDEEGTFEFDPLPPGPYRVTFSKQGFRAQTTDVKLGGGETVDVTYRVTREAVNFMGTVKQAGDRKPLAGVQILIFSAGGSGEDGADGSGSGESLVREVYTEDGGAFSVRGLEPGDYRVRLQADGYKSVDYEERIRQGQRTTVTYYLRTSYESDLTVQTTARRERESVNRQTLDREEIKRIPGTGGDVVRSVQNLPGVARASFGSGQVVVRGSAPESTLTFLEGDEIPLAFHFLGGPSVVTSEMIESVDFYPGNFRSRYGRALGGIINLETKEPATDGLHGFAEVDVIDANAQIEGPITEDLSFAASFRRSYIDAFLPALVPDDALGFTVAPRYYDGQAWLTYEPNEHHTFQLFGYASDDRIEALFDTEDPPGNSNVRLTGLELNNGFGRGQFRWEWRPDGIVEQDLMASYGANYFSFEAARNFFFDLTFWQFQGRYDLRLDAAEELNINTGLDMQAGTAVFSSQIPRLDGGGGGGGGAPNVNDSGVLAQDERTPLYNPAMYAEAEVMPIDGLEIIPGGRLDYYGQIEEFSPSPRLTVRYDITDDVTAKGGVGLFTQPPSPGEPVENFGNPDLTYEKATHYAAGAEVTPLDYLEIDTTLFYQDMYDLVRQTDAFREDENGDPEPVIYNNAGEGRSYGMELLVRHYSENNFFGWLAYTLSRAERRDPDGGWRPFQYDQTHNLTLVGGYELPKNWEISARFRLTTGNPRTPVVGSVYNADTDDYSPVSGETYSDRLGTFHQLDLRVDKTWVFNTWKFGAFLDVINAYNANNPEGTRYNYDYSESAPVRGLPIIPTLGMNAEF